MSKPIKINEHIYYLLIERALNHFTITTLRNELQAYTKEYDNPVEARRFVYKQICRLASKNLLARKNNKSPSLVIYRKTSLFKSSVFIKKVKQTSVLNLHLNTSKVSSDNYFESELNQEKKIHETEILIVSSEIKEYQRLMNKFPQNSESILQFHDKGQMRLLSLKGKLAALKNLQRIK